MLHMIYEPREDSYLLQKNISRYAHGRILDMGTGSGIQAKEAAKTAESVIAVDINPVAIKENHDNIEYIESDLFEHIKDKFDLIIFNPPYLPNDSRVIDIALDGGKHGYELIRRFLENVNEYLKTDGRILLLFSSLSKKDEIEEFINNNCLNYEQIDSQKLDFEELYVYLIEKSELLKDLEAKGAADVHFLTKGHRGIIYTGILQEKKITIKSELAESNAIGRIENEVKFLKLLNKEGIGPKLLFSGNGYFVYEFVKGLKILEFLNSANSTKCKHVLIDIIRQLQKLDELGINKDEMHHPLKHILVDDKLVLIDFERARYTEEPQNITQFCQFLIDYRKVFNDQGIIINKDEMIQIAKQYKADHDTKQLLEVFE